MRLFAPFALALMTTAGHAQVSCTSDAMIVFDGSGSMAEMGFNDINEPRIFEARRAMRTVLPPIAQARRLGLVVYGPGGTDACTGVDLRFAPRADAADAITAAVEGLQPAGSTPLTQAVRRAAQVLDHVDKPATIVLVTDGKETCGGQPCVLAADLAAEGLDTVVHVIGFKVRGAFFSWDRDPDNDYNASESVARCLADRTGGTYTGAETLDELIAALRKTLSCAFLF